MSKLLIALDGRHTVSDYIRLGFLSALRDQHFACVSKRALSELKLIAIMAIMLSTLIYKILGTRSLLSFSPRLKSPDLLRLF